VTIASQFKTGSMAQHVSSTWNAKFAFFALALHHPVEAIRCKRSAEFAHEYKW
jgi:hypothetical protein